MATLASDPTWPDALRRVPQDELADLCSLSVGELDELVDSGALAPLGGPAGSHEFSASCILPLQEASRLRTDHALDLFTVGVLLGYLQRIAHLEQLLRGHNVPIAHPATLPREGPTPWREQHD